ncbi:hypothetical protein IQ230_06935 [Gloeocapsopsis crepidinum LEGE 06123]|uniref:Low temperature-induced protein n=1 Tax=Gloeocapsopsis crepidinum LEGE 06123 TaxID=588587 RepID=A0ABR9UPW8_9CHRO|nr:hypothetical protein [Gloeocapsopsis crepidinum]MBE9190100.1 hypothetical protein [Gloeocapsopsis crepidinum LEGE 06123]
MKSMIDWVKSSGLRRVITVVLVAITFLVAPAFNESVFSQAQAASAGSVDENPVTRDTVKRIKEKAEDFGDSAERPIGDTGLKNLKKLGENIPETLELKARQTGVTFNPNEADKKAAMEEAQSKAERN